MDIDTRSKRSSALGIGVHGLRVLPVSDGTVALDDRAHLGLVYARPPTSTAANGRMSMVLFDLPFGSPTPHPDGTIGATDRQQLVSKYTNISASVSGAGVYTQLHHHHHAH